MIHTCHACGCVQPARCVVLLVAKTPIAGDVKTRLCPPATAEQAAEIAAASLLDTLATVRATPGARPVVALSGEVGEATRADELSAALHGTPLIGQGEGGLATRVSRTLEQVTELYPGLNVLLLGMDTPQVTPAMLTGAANALSAPDIDGVLGPAVDGGWWLLGLRDPGHRPTLDAVRDTPMSTPETGEHTVHALAEAGITLTTVAEIPDVDTIADARVVAAEIPFSRFASAVAEVLNVAVVPDP